MSKSIMVAQIRGWLDNHESAPSAWCLVKSFHANVQMVSDADCDMAYNRSEGLNDSERDLMIDSMTDDQLMGLAAMIVEISNEKLNEV
jgi:hypothetical protein